MAFGELAKITANGMRTGLLSVRNLLRRPGCCRFDHCSTDSAEDGTAGCERETVP